MSLRRLRRAFTLAFALVLCILDSWVARRRGPITLERRARWMQTSARRALDALAVQVRVEGQLPSHGLVVSNHLSYLDIAIFSAIMPCFFVSKAEIGRWPYFGRAARAGGTIFLDRASRGSAEAAAAQIAERFKLPVPVLLFPEGTSTDGTRVLRFHSRLLDPAVRAGAPITAAAVRYVAGTGTDERQLCWFGDQAFLPHLWKVLGLPGFSAEVSFAQPQLYANRRAAALEAHAQVVNLRAR